MGLRCWGWLVCGLVLGVACSRNEGSGANSSSAQTSIDGSGNGGDQSGIASGFGSEGSNASLGCDSATYCGGSGFTCGIHAVGNCGEVDCGPCRFHGQDVGWGDIVAAPDGSIHLVFFDGETSELVYARVTDEGLERETIAQDVRGETAAIAIGEDNAPHVVFVAEQVMYAHKTSDAAWAIDMIAESATNVALALDGEATVHMVLTSEHPQTHQPQLIHVVPSGSTFTSTPIEELTPIGAPALGRSASGEIVVATRSGIYEMAVLELKDGAFVRDPDVPMLDDQPAEWSLVVTSGGVLHVLALLGNYTLRTGSQLVALSRESGQWSVEPVGGSAQVTRGLVWANGGASADHLHMLYFAYREDGLFYTRPASSRRLNIEPACDEGDVRLAVDAADQPHILYRCSVRGPRYLAPAARYTDEYVQACNSGAQQICDRACECGAPDCCYGAAGSDSGNCTFGPGGAGKDLCLADALVGLCGDLTADPEAMLACRPLLAQEAECSGTKVVVPEQCWALLSSGY